MEIGAGTRDERDTCRRRQRGEEDSTDATTAIVHSYIYELAKFSAGARAQQLLLASSNSFLPG